MLILAVCFNIFGSIVWQEEVAAIPYAGSYLVRMFLYLPFFVLGAVCGHFKPEGFSKLPKILGNGLGFIGAIAFAVLLYYVDMGLAIKMVIWPVWLCFIYFMVPEKWFKKSKAVDAITNPSFIIFTSHIIFLNILEWLLPNESGKATSLKIMLALAGAYGIYYLLKLVAPKVLGILSGNRKV